MPFARQISLALFLLLQSNAAFADRPSAATWRVQLPPLPGEVPTDAGTLKTRLFARIDYPLRLREIDSEIKGAEAVVQSYRKRLAEYERFKYSKAFFITRENLRLGLLQAELRLANLKEEKSLLRRHRRDLLRLHGDRRTAFHPVPTG